MAKLGRRRRATCESLCSAPLYFSQLKWKLLIYVCCLTIIIMNGFYFRVHMSSCHKCNMIQEHTNTRISSSCNLSFQLEIRPTINEKSDRFYILCARLHTKFARLLAISKSYLDDVRLNSIVMIS